METQTTTTAIQAFRFITSDSNLRVVKINTLPWFVAKDVCDILGLTDVSKSLERLEDDEKILDRLFVPAQDLTRKVFVSGPEEQSKDILEFAMNPPVNIKGQNREMWLVNESGLYNLIFRSTKPEAKVFRKWVTSEVIPSILHKGSYELAPKTNSYVNPRTLPFIDATNIPYDTTQIENKAVRRITVDDVTYFSINDIQRAINAATCSVNIAKKLNRKTTLARKILIFGNTHPAWFCTQTGVDLIIASSRVLKAQSQNAIN